MFFHNEFYPTPSSVLDLMGLNISGRVVLEPSAGKGDIVRYCHSNGATKVLSYEINEELRQILAPISTVLGGDFLEAQAEDVVSIDTIVMNPPFSKALEHIMHAWRIAPEGCEIYALCNFDSIDSYEGRKHGFKRVLEEHGDHENLGPVFAQAERTTQCDIGLIKLFKPVTSCDYNFDLFLSTEEEYHPDQVAPGMIQYNEIQSIVNRYIGALKAFDKFAKIQEEVNDITDPLGFSGLRVTAGYNENITSPQDFAIKLQRSSWKMVFNKMELRKYVTNKVQDKIDRFCEKQSRYPFTVRNIWAMMDIIVQTSQQSLNESLIDSIDNFTMYTHENRYNVPGWKTNAGHMLNKKFIINYLVQPGYSGGLELRWSDRRRDLEDLVKVLCNLKGMDFDKQQTLHAFFQSHDSGIERNTWYDWTFFKVKGFLKGTFHIQFKSSQDWQLLNSTYAKLKGVDLPEQASKSKAEPKKKRKHAKPHKTKATSSKGAIPTVQEAQEIFNNYFKQSA